MARRRRPVPPRSYLNLDGGSGSMASTPDHADFAVAEVDAAWLFAPTTWLPSLRRGWGGQWSGGWLFEQVGGGSWRFWFRDPVAVVDRAITNSTLPPWADGEERWIRIKFQPDNGLSQHQLQIFHADPSSSYEDAVWTQLGPDSLAKGAYTMGDSITSFKAGGATSSLVHVGKMYEHVMRASLDGAIVANPRFDQQAAGATGFTDAQGNRWAINGTATIQSE